MTKPEVINMVTTAINGYEDKIRANGCATNIGCHKGKELDNYLRGHLASNLNDLKNNKEWLEKEFPKLKQEVKDMKEVVSDINKAIKGSYFTVAVGIILSVLLLGLNTWTNISAKNTFKKNESIYKNNLEKKIDKLLEMEK